MYEHSFRPSDKNGRGIMATPDIKKTCPIAPVREDGTPGLCREDRCAWWTHGECAMVKIAKAVGGQK